YVESNSAGCSGTIAAGASVTCTVTNTFQVTTGTLVVIKHVMNTNGGTATADAWQLHVLAGPSFTKDVLGSPQPGAEAPGTSYTLAAGTYKVTETGGPSGYTFGGYTGCSNGGTITVTAGATVTCTLTNHDNPPSAHSIIVHLEQEVASAPELS